MAALGWTEDQYKLLFQPLVLEGQEAVWSMGDDAPPAFLSRLPRPLWDYCKQRFAQVTNPPIDPLRETQVMSLRVLSGREGCAQFARCWMRGQMKRLAEEFAAAASTLTFPARTERERRQRCRASESAPGTAASAKDSPGLILLTDRGIDAERAALPALLALAVAWQVLVEANAWDVPLIVESGQVIDTHHIALLVAAGASAVFPYLALEQAVDLRPDGVARYRFAVEKGLRKVHGAHGRLDVASYRNSQLFEVIGLDPALCAEFSPMPDACWAGKTLERLLRGLPGRHAAASLPRTAAALQDSGLYRFRHNGERHANSPEIVRRLHRYIKSPTDENFKLVQRAGRRKGTGRHPRSAGRFASDSPIPVEEVETEASLLSRFSTQAMSLGAISPETHSTLAIAMNRLGGRSNTGEGGEDPGSTRKRARPTIA